MHFQVAGPLNGGVWFAELSAQEVRFGTTGTQGHIILATNLSGCFYFILDSTPSS